MKIDILETEGCPSAEPTIRLIETVSRRIGVTPELRRIRVTEAEQPLHRKFFGSPTVIVNCCDLEDIANRIPTLACRIYPNGSGVPPEWMIEASLLRALQPRHILFLCVANSARSQMAEGIARKYALPNVMISSAGSRATGVNPEAIEVMHEIGIDISSRVSKNLSQIETDSVEAVITLCNEQICPLFPRPVTKLHWGFPDPAGKGLEAFREVRDVLVERLRRVFFC